jgi:hypothetical protein
MDTTWDSSQWPTAIQLPRKINMANILTRDHHHRTRMAVTRKCKFILTRKKNRLAAMLTKAIKVRNRVMGIMLRG